MSAVAVTAVGALGWCSLRAPVSQIARVIGDGPAAKLRLRAGLGASRMLGRRALVMLGDSRLEQLGVDGLGAGDRLIVRAAVAGTTARFWSGCVNAVPLGDGPSTFVIWLGINDVFLQLTPPDRVLGYLRAIASDVLRGPENRVLLLEQIPLSGSADEGTRRLERASVEINRGLAELARELPRTRVLPLWTRFAPGSAERVCGEQCYQDPLHLNEHGSRIVRQLLIAALRADP